MKGFRHHIKDKSSSQHSGSKSEHVLVDEFEYWTTSSEGGSCAGSVECGEGDDGVIVPVDAVIGCASAVPSSPPLPPPAHMDVDVEPPPCPVAPRPPAVRGPSTRGLFVYHTAFGKVTYYTATNKYEAVCTFPGHGDCRVTRTAKEPPPRRMGSHPHQGRCAAA